MTETNLEEYWETESSSRPGVVYKLVKDKKGEYVCECWGYKRWRHCKHQVVVIRGKAKHVVVDKRLQELQFTSSTNMHRVDLHGTRCEKCGMPKESWQYVVCRGFKIAGSYDDRDIIVAPSTAIEVMRYQNVE